MVDWKHNLEKKWATLHFGEVKVETRGRQHVLEIQVFLGDLDPHAVRVELYADGVMGSAPVRQEMERVQSPAGALRAGIYRASVSASRLATDYTARIVPHCAGVAVPLEVGSILWQR